MTAASGDEELTAAEVDDFIGFMKFIARDNLWDQAKAAIESAGISTISISTEPIRIIRKMIDEELLPGDSLGEASRSHALTISHSHCGSPTSDEEEDDANEEGEDENEEIEEEKE